MSANLIQLIERWSTSLRQCVSDIALLALLLSAAAVGFLFNAALQGPFPSESFWTALGALATFIATVVALRIAVWQRHQQMVDQKRDGERELETIKRALTAEIFGIAADAFKGHQKLIAVLSEPRSVPGATMHEAEEVVRMPGPVVYPSNASRIGLLGDRAHDVVLFFHRVETAKVQVQRIRRDFAQATGPTTGGWIALPKQTIGEANTVDICDALLQAALTATVLVDTLAAGTVDEGPGRNFMKAVTEAESAWLKNPHRALL